MARFISHPWNCCVYVLQFVWCDIDPAWLISCNLGTTWSLALECGLIWHSPLPRWKYHQVKFKCHRTFTWVKIWLTLALDKAMEFVYYYSNSRMYFLELRTWTSRRKHSTWKMAISFTSITGGWTLVWVENIGVHSILCECWTLGLACELIKFQ